MNNSVVIKGNKHGITVILEEEKNFDDLKGLIKEKFEQSSKFFGQADMALSLEGKELSDEEQLEIVKLIMEVTSLNIVCIVDNDEVKDAKFENAIVSQRLEQERKQSAVQAQPVSSELASVIENQGLFYKGTLRSGQVLESEASVVVLGDVNPGAKIVAKGNVVVLGSLRGNIFAGADGNENAFVVALEMNPMQIKIGDIIARCADGEPAKKVKKKKEKEVQPKLAYIYDSNIYIEDLTQENLEDIVIN